MNMRVSSIIVNAKELLTLAGSSKPRTNNEMSDLSIIQEGAIAINNDKIVAVGTTAEVLSQYDSDVIIDASNKVVMPGFVDPHTHPIFVHTRENEFEMRIEGKTYVEISKKGGGILSSIRAVREASQEELVSLAKKRIKKMIAMGTTTLEAKSGYGLTTESELKMLRVIRQLQEELPLTIIPTFMGAHEIPIEYRENRNEYIRIMNEEMLPQIKAESLAKYVDIFTEEHVYTIPESREILTAALNQGFKVRMHADEIVAYGGSELAGELKAVSADHLGAASDEGIKALKENGVIATLLPGTIFSLGMKSYARARDMIDAGVAVALATDYNPGSCNCDSMQFVISLACIQMRMNVAEAITAATINAAHALELASSIGSIEVGKQADIIILDMPGYRFLPYHFGSNNVETVIKNGDILWQS